MIDIAIVLFGIVRKAAPFLESIEANLFEPLDRAGLTHVVVGRLNETDFLNNPRSQEEGRPDRAALIFERFPNVLSKAQSPVQIEQDLAHLSRYGDIWNDGFRSLANLLFQLNSLSAGTDMALTSGAQTVIFLRPDLIYHDSFANVLATVKESPASRLWVPDWQYSTGLNDRFAIARGLEATQTYGKRLSLTVDFVQRRGRPLHSERLLAYAVGTKRIPVEFMHQRASRCRLDGSVKLENHDLKWHVRVRTLARLKFFPQSFA